MGTESQERYDDGYDAGQESRQDEIETLESQVDILKERVEELEDYQNNVRSMAEELLFFPKRP